MPEPASEPTVDNKVAVLILQHPQEQDRVLGTAKLICSTLAHAKLSVGLSWRNLGHALGEPAEAKDWGVLYLGSAHAAQARARWSRSTARASRWPTRTARVAGLKGIVALDGNWAQAKALWWRNAWLTRLRRFVVVPDGPSLYGDLRREARPDAVSTLEAVALGLVGARRRCGGAGSSCWCRSASCRPRRAVEGVAGRQTGSSDTRR